MLEQPMVELSMLYNLRKYRIKLYKEEARRTVATVVFFAFLGAILTAILAYGS